MGDGFDDTFARAAGEIERYASTPVQVRLTLSQLLLLGGLIGIATSVEGAPGEMVDHGIELAHGIVAELDALELSGVAGVILASLPEKEMIRYE